MKNFFKIILVIISISIICSTVFADVITYVDKVEYENYPAGAIRRTWGIK